MDVTIAGTGLVTPLGDDLDQTWASLLAQRAIKDHARLPGGSQRVTQIAFRAAREAIDRAGWKSLDDPRVGLVVGTSKGTIESWMEGQLDPIGLANVSANLASQLGMGPGPRLTLASACASSLHALVRGVLMIQWGQADRVIVVGAEASVHPLFLASFQRLGVLPGRGIGCRPFDQHRAGFLMSEAAAAVCLEPHAHGVKIDRFALGADATHITAGDLEGRTLRSLLGRVIRNDPVDLVHAHGTGTVLNDPTELAAIEHTVSREPTASAGLSLYSHKGALGHSLGAAGLVAVVLSEKIHREGIVPGNIRTTRPLKARSLIISNTPISKPIHRSICIAAGFGGSAAVVGLVS